MLPAGIGYPHLIAYGGDLSSDWLVIERVPGRPLSRCWPAMSQTDRRDAVDQLGDRLRLLHATPAPDLPPLRRPTPAARAGADGDRMRSPRSSPGSAGPPASRTSTRG